MTLSNLQTFGLVLHPGFAEHIMKYAESNGNLAINGVGLGMKDGRNYFYVGSALAVIGAVGIATSGPSLATLASLGLGFTLTTAATKKICDMVEIFQESVRISPYFPKFE